MALESSSYEEEEEEAPAVAVTTEPSVRKFAVPSKHFVASIQGRKTEIVQFSYDDYILVSLFLSVPFCPQIQCFSGLQVL
jgi:hypothetical protein